MPQTSLGPREIGSAARKCSSPSPLRQDLLFLRRPELIHLVLVPGVEPAIGYAPVPDAHEVDEVVLQRRLARARCAVGGHRGSVLLIDQHVVQPEVQRAFRQVRRLPQEREHLLAVAVAARVAPVPGT